jgi:hypothetical protein
MSGQNWIDPNAYTAPLADSYGPQPFFRDELDAFRSMWRRTPEAQFPDGYLGTIQTRHDDRLLGGIKDRVNQRSYQRGVHKGERIDPGDYFWPEQFNLMSGIVREATTGLRYSPPGGGMPAQVLTNDGRVSNQPYQSPLREGQGTMSPRGIPSGFQNWPQPPMSVDPQRASQLARLAPGRSW